MSRYPVAPQAGTLVQKAIAANTNERRLTNGKVLRAHYDAEIKCIQAFDINFCAVTDKRPAPLPLAPPNPRFMPILELILIEIDCGQNFPVTRPISSPWTFRRTASFVGGHDVLPILTQVVCIRLSNPSGCISDNRSNFPVRSHHRTRAANSFTSERLLPTA